MLSLATNSLVAVNAGEVAAQNRDAEMKRLNYIRHMAKDQMRCRIYIIQRRGSLLITGRIDFLLSRNGNTYQTVD